MSPPLAPSQRHRRQWGQLGIVEFLEQQQATILRHLKETFLRRRNEEQAALLFIADSLPLASAIIQVGSTTVGFKRACDWVKGRSPDADHGNILTVLTLLYTVQRGCEAALQSGDRPSQELWNEMSQKVNDALLSV